MAAPLALFAHSIPSQPQTILNRAYAPELSFI